MYRIEVIYVIYADYKKNFFEYFFFFLIYIINLYKILESYFFFNCTDFCLVIS